MQIRCPHCHNGIELVDDSDFQSIDCPSCGSQFGLVDVEQEDVQTLSRGQGSTAIDDAAIPGKGPVRSIKQFELLEKVGQGAFGIVWRARDTELDRIVAIKVPQKKVLSPSDYEQFLREARAVAQLSHPNIVSVYEAGRDGDSLYIASDFIEGTSLAEKIAAQSFAPREAVELCVKIAAALEHAHESGVIHRDLKPSNIMLTQDDEPQVMDFGLAKRDTGEITMTVEGQPLGTPAYMPPEQARGEGHHVDRRADVYSLGVILYELLSGELPFRGAIQMLLHQVIHVEAPSPRKLNSAISRDLETITLKCLQKEPGRRYQSAAELSADLEHWLSGHPITARAITWMERSWRWCKRKPAVAVLSTLVVLILLTLSIVGPLVALKQTHLRETAENSAKAAETAREDEKKSRIQAEKNFEAAQKVVDEFLTHVSQSDLLNQPQMEPLQRQLLERARKYYEEFVKQKTDDPKLKAKLGDAHWRLGNVFHLLGDDAAAIAEFQQTRAIFEQLSKEHPDVPEYADSLADSYNNLGIVLQMSGKPDEALEAHKSAITIFEQLSKEHPDIPEHADSLAGSYNNLGIVMLDDLGKPVEAMEAYTKANILFEQLSKEYPDRPRYASGLAASYSNLGNVLDDLGKPDEAMEAYTKTSILFAQLSKEHPDVSEYAGSLAKSYNNLGLVHEQAHNPDEALEAHKSAIMIREQLTKEHPDIPRHANKLAASYGNLGNLLDDLGKPDEAMEAYQKAFTILEQLNKEHPDMPEYASGLAGSYNNLGLGLAQARKYDEAMEAHKSAITIGEQLSKEHPDVPEYVNKLAISYANLGLVLAQARKPDEALEAHKSAITIGEQLSKEYPDLPRYANELASSYNYFANVLDDLGKPDEAMEAHKSALTIRDQLSKEYPDRPEYANNLAISYANLGNVLDDLGKLDEAMEAYTKANILFEQLSKEYPDRPEYANDLAVTCINSGLLEQNRQRYAEAISYYESSLKLIQSLQKNGQLAHKFAGRDEEVERILAVLRVVKRALEDLPFVLAQPPVLAAQLLLVRGQVLLDRSDYAGAVESGEKLAQLTIPDDQSNARAGNLYNAARLLSLASAAAANDEDLGEAERTALVDKYAARAVALLNEDRSLGFFKDPANVAHMKQDTDLDPLRERDDFKQFLKELEASATEPDEPATDD